MKIIYMLITFFITSCATIESSKDSIKNGMTENEVVSIMQKKPNEIISNSSGNTLIFRGLYCDLSKFSLRDKCTLIVKFKDELVIRTTMIEPKQRTPLENSIHGLEYNMYMHDILY